MIKTGKEPEKGKAAQLIYHRIVFLPKDIKVTLKMEIKNYNLKKQTASY